MLRYLGVSALLACAAAAEGIAHSECSEGGICVEGASHARLLRAKFPGYKGGNHPNDGNEGNEGNEGDEGSDPTPKPKPTVTIATNVSGGDTNPYAGCTIHGNPVDKYGYEIGNWYKRPGHPNDGNEGNEGNEGGASDMICPDPEPEVIEDPEEPTPAPAPEVVEEPEEPAPAPMVAEDPEVPVTKDLKCTINGNPVDSAGGEKTKHWRRAGHGNDGNEGNEGNEGAHDAMTCVEVVVNADGWTSEEEVPSPVTEPAPPPAPPSEAKYIDGKYEVCVTGNKQFFGHSKPKRVNQPDGIWVYADGTCEIQEYAGGFDGYWSINAADKHEEYFAQAVRDLLGVNNNSAGNQAASKFLKTLRDISKPLDMDFPQDRALADGGKRMENIEKASAVCTSMLSVKQCK